MTIEKVYDELYGMIDDLKKQIAAGGGGDSVTITPALESGTKVADYTIGEDSGSLYAPTSVTPFIDFSNEIVASTNMTDNALSYTATEDCVVIMGIGSTTSASAKIYINDVIVKSVYSGGNTQITGKESIFLKEGQSLHTADYGSVASVGQLNYAVYGIYKPTAVQTRKTTKKK